MKYSEETMIALAIYDEGSDNPFLAAMPEMVGRTLFMDMLRSTPELPHSLPAMSVDERRQVLPVLSTLFAPMQYMYAIYDHLYWAITTTYLSQTVAAGIRQMNSLYTGRMMRSYATQADTGSILGVSGVGKTSTVRHCLSTMPQVIEHTSWRGQPFYQKQVLYLCVECPSDCSVKTLALNIMNALDQAIGSRYVETLTSMRSVAASAVATQVKILCLRHHVGLVIVDEIQNAILTARKNKQIKPLIKFLVELTNETCTSIYFVGTPMSEELFTSEEHLKRRTRGIRLLPLKPDGAYRSFLTQIWPYQLTPKIAPVTESLANKLYDYSGGIPSYILKIFQESQAQTLLQGASCLNGQIMQKAINALAIKIPKTYAGGISISEFEKSYEQDSLPAEEQEDSVPVSPIIQNEETEETNAVKRLYSHKRGRKAARRNEVDILTVYEAGGNILEQLKASGQVEVWEELC